MGFDYPFLQDMAPNAPVQLLFRPCLLVAGLPYQVLWDEGIFAWWRGLLDCSHALESGGLHSRLIARQCWRVAHLVNAEYEN